MKPLLHRQHVDQPDVRILREQLRTDLAQGCRDQPGQVRLPAFIIGKGVEDPERRSIDAEGVPDDGTRLLLDDGAAALQECLDLGFPAGLGLDERENSDGQVMAFSLAPRGRAVT